MRRFHMPSITKCTAPVLAISTASLITIPTTSFYPAAYGATTGDNGPASAVFSGRISAGSGSPADGATVGVYAWPEFSSSNQPTLGTDFPLVPLGASVVESDGSFSVSVESGRLKKFVDTQGLPSGTSVNVSVISMDGGSSSTSYPSTIKYINDSRGVSSMREDEQVADENSIGDAPVEDSVIDDTGAGSFATLASSRSAAIGSAPSDSGIQTGDKLILQMHPASAASSPTKSQISARAGASAASSGSPCAQRIASLGQRSHIVGSFTSTTGAPYAAYFTFSSSSTSTIGIGVSYSGANGSFHQSGTKTVKSSGSTGFSPFSGTGGRTYKTQYAWSKYRLHSCSPGPITWYEARADYWAGGATGGRFTKVVAYTQCVPQERNSWFTKSTNSAYTYANGAAVKGAGLGVDLSTRTGYSSATSIKIHPTGSKPAVCGNGGLPQSAAGRLLQIRGT